MLELKDVTAGYYPGQPVLRNFNLILEAGEKVAILGQNGAGKSTVGKVIMGLVPYVNGSVRFNDKNLLKMRTEDRIQCGIAYFMQGGRVFPQMTVGNNMKAATLHLSENERREQLDWAKEQFPLLKNKNRIGLQAGNLSGGERHQLALAMVLCGVPGLKLLIADEPNAGVAPNMKENNISKYILHEQILHTSVLLIEQIRLPKNLNFKTIIISHSNEK